MDSITQRLLDQACFDELPDDLPTWHIGRLAYPDDPGQQAGFIDYLAKEIERGKLEACDHSFLPSDEQPGVLKATCIGGDEYYRRYESTESVPRCTYKALRTFLERYPYQFTPLGPYLNRWLRTDHPPTQSDGDSDTPPSLPWCRQSADEQRLETLLDAIHKMGMDPLNMKYGSKESLFKKLCEVKQGKQYLTENTFETTWRLAKEKGLVKNNRKH